MSYWLGCCADAVDVAGGAQVPDLSVVAAQAAVQVDRAREAARRQVAAALSAKPKLQLHVSLDAPKVAVPIPAAGDEGVHAMPHWLFVRSLWNHDNRSDFQDMLELRAIIQLCYCTFGSSFNLHHASFLARQTELAYLADKRYPAADAVTVVLDFGRFVLDSNAAALERLGEEEAAVYLPFQLVVRNVSAYLVDGAFDWAFMGARLGPLLEGGGIVNAGQESQAGTLL